ncbi:MAG: hypothetical protein ACKO7Z_07140, partial [Cyanobacteriota bacterium]
MSHRLILTLIASGNLGSRRNRSSGGFTLTPAILLVLALVVGGLGVATVLNWSNLAASLGGEDPREVA